MNQANQKEGGEELKRKTLIEKYEGVPNKLKEQRKETKQYINIIVEKASK
jgi:hypothetical protein